MFNEENLISLTIFLDFRIILVLPVVDFILCFQKKDLNARESIFKQIYELSGCLLVVFKSIFIVCVNPSIGLADKYLFEMSLVFSNFSLF